MIRSLHSIGPAARQVGRSEDTLRDWERRGLITPIRDSVGRRLYTDGDIEMMRSLAANGNRREARVP
jgi:DNA-binding transcriptional MerR regulator